MLQSCCLPLQIWCPAPTADSQPRPTALHAPVPESPGVPQVVLLVLSRFGRKETWVQNKLPRQVRAAATKKLPPREKDHVSFHLIHYI